MNQQFDILAAIERATTRRDLGIERVSAKAERIEIGWNEFAYDWLRRFLLGRTNVPFLTEEFSAWAFLNGCRPPHDGRAWGAVMQRAARKKLIVRVGYAPANSSNRSPKCLWSAL